MRARKRKELGQYIVADPEICHGQLTFKGTRILVKSVLSYVAHGKDWDWISQAYFGKVIGKRASKKRMLSVGDSVASVGLRMAQPNLRNYLLTK